MYGGRSPADAAGNENYTIYAARTLHTRHVLCSTGRFPSYIFSNYIIRKDSVPMSNTEKFTGRVWVLGDDIDTDIIIPTEYLALPTVEDMKQYGFSPLRPELAGQIREGRHHRRRKEFWLRFFQRAGAGDHQGAENQMCHRQILRPHFLPQFHQQRPASH